MNILLACCRKLPLLAACCVLACSDERGVEEAPRGGPLPGLETIKGHAVLGHEVRAIQRCGEDEPVWAIDSTGFLWDVHHELAPGGDPYEKIFAVVRGISGEAPSDGFGAEYSGSFVVKQVIYAAGEGFGCDLDLNGFQFRLAGNEPFWNLTITDTTAELSRLGAQDQLWSGIQSEWSDGSFNCMGEGSGAGDLEVRVLHEPCHDSMSGAFYGYSASVLLAGEELFGCALRGTGGQREN